jgi:CBS domain containing-hemolysin-like protein
VITAVGMVNELYVMMTAVIVAVIVMLAAAKPLTDFIAARPSLIILCLGFLLMIGLVLVVDGFGVHVPKSYVYAAIAFSVMIEIFNQIALRNRRKLAQTIPPRRRAAYAILRLLGGVPPSGPGALAAEVADAAAEPPGSEVFSSLEQRMMRGVLGLSRRPVTSIMTHRADVEWIDSQASCDAVVEKLGASRYRTFPIARGSIDELIGIARKEDILTRCMAGGNLELEKIAAEPVAVPASATILSAFEHFKGAPIEVAIVVDEYGGFEGLVTRTDLLEAIAGELPKEAAAPAIAELADGSLQIQGSLPLSELRERLQLSAVPAGSYQTAAGLVLAILGRLPQGADEVQWEDWKLRVETLDGLSIERLSARRAGRDAAGAAAAALSPG